MSRGQRMLHEMIDEDRRLFPGVSERSLRLIWAASAKRDHSYVLRAFASDVDLSETEYHYLLGVVSPDAFEGVHKSTLRAFLGRLVDTLPSAQDVPQPLPAGYVERMYEEFDNPRHRVLCQAQAVEQFFGACLGGVDMLIMSIFLFPEEFPEWLKDCPTIAHLPRYVDGDRTTAWPSVSLPWKHRIPEAIYWIVEHLKGEWTFKDRQFQLELDSDAILFKMCPFLDE